MSLKMVFLPSLTMENKKIYLCVTNDLRFDQRLRRMADTLASMGQEVVLVGRRKRGESSIKSDHSFKRLTCWVAKGPFFYLEYNIKLFFYLFFRQWDIVVANDADSLLACGAARILRRKMLVYDSHELFTEVPELKGKYVVRLVWHLIQRFFVPFSVLALTVGDKIAVRLTDMYGKKFYAIRNVPSLKVASGQRSEKIMLYQGTLNVKRGIEEAINSLTVLKDWKLWIAGTGPIEEQLKTLVVSENLEDRVVFYGGVSPEQLHDLTCTATVGLNMLSSDSLNYYFSLANKFFDYVQAEIPSICMNYPEYQKLNEQFEVAILVEDCSSDALISAINTLEDEDLATRLVANCEAAKQEWNWERERDKLTTLYEPLLS